MTKRAMIQGVLIGIFVGMVYWGTEAYQQAIAYEEKTTQLISSMEPEQQVYLHIEKIAKTILGDLYNDKLSQQIAQAKSAQEDARTNAKAYTLYFFCLLLGVLFLSFSLSMRAFTFWGSLAAMVTLIFGLITPILMVTVHKEIEYLGDMVLSFESQSVSGSILKLYRGGDWLVAGVIVLFSVLVPIAKVFSLLFVSVFMESKIAQRVVTFFKILGKWSMVDVFVVAIFLVYLTADKAQTSRAEIEMGLYFFMAYVIVSMLLSLSADKILNQQAPK
jgi:hypothetical protein